jgi:RimJ/RimL family protein N-acetyltransferase
MNRNIQSPIPLRKPAKIIGNHLVFRNAEATDAEFITRIRTDPDKSKYLSTTSPDVGRQITWLEKYAKDDSQIYFLICESMGLPIGTVRIYDCIENSFCWGSWILAAGSSPSASIESVLIVYHFALHLGFKSSHFEVRPENRSVLRFHERFGALRVKETAESIYYRIHHDQILASLEKYSEFLPRNIEISW